MSGDWIKMRTDLYRDPKVIVMADRLMRSDSELSRYVNQNTQRDMTVTRNVMRNVTVGALVAVWGVMRHQGERSEDDLRIDNVSHAIVDDIADLPGFGAAMLSSGWLVEDDQGLCFPGFFATHNVDPKEEAKAKNRERQRRHRERNRNVTPNVTVTHRVEKSREEKSIKEDTPLTPQRGKRRKAIKVDDCDIPKELNTTKCQEALARWLEHKRAKNKQYKSPDSVNTLLKTWSERGPDRFVAAVDHSIGSNYEGLYEDKQNGRQRQTTASRCDSSAEYDAANTGRF
jgi:hypothetical protein